MNSQDILRDPDNSGVYRIPDNAELLEAGAPARGLASWRVDLAAVRDKLQFLAAMAHALVFPTWFGANWDALGDCLADLSWREAEGYVIVLENCGVFARAAPDDFETAVEVFDAAAKYWRGEEVPFWVFVGGIDPEQFDLPLPPKA